MMLRIDNTTKLHDIQSAFTNAFTYLKLEFFKPVTGAQPPKKMKRMPMEHALSGNRRGRVIEISIEGTSKVHDVEDAFQKIAGLDAQVFRKSANLWIETSLTDDWTLDQQNKEGELLNAMLIKPPVNTNR